MFDATLLHAGKYLKPRESGIESLCGGLRDALRDAFPYDAFPYDAFVYDAFPYDAFLYDAFVYDAFVYNTFVYDAFPYDAFLYTMPLRILFFAECLSRLIVLPFLGIEFCHRYAFILFHTSYCL